MWIKTINGVLVNTDALTTISYNGNYTIAFMGDKNIIISNNDSRDEIIEAICNDYDFLEVL